MIDEEMTARLLRLGGMRPDVPAAREGRVKRAFLDEVRATARARVVRRRMTTAAAVLGMAAAAIVVIRLGFTREVTTPVVEVVATVERLEGDGRRQSGSSAPLRIALGDPVHVGDRVESSATGRVGLRLANGASLRFDHGSRAHLVSLNRIELDAGAVYVDTGPDLGTAALRLSLRAPRAESRGEAVPSVSAPGLEIATSFGIVRDIGTQFEIRLRDSSLRVRVRSGVVEVHREADVSSARPGTELTVTSDFATTSRSVEPYGQDWAWAASLGPAFDIEGRSLSAFLEHVCREQGWTLVYADSKLALEASGIMLHGSTQGLQPSDALAIVLATTGVTHTLKDGQLEVARAVRP